MSETTGIVIKNVLDSELKTPSVGKTTFGFNDDGIPVTKNSDGIVTPIITAETLKSETHYEITLQQNTAANLCVAFDGTLPNEESAILGINEVTALDEDIVQIRFSGITNAVLGVDASIAVGDRLTTSTNGKVKKATSTMPTIGRALTTGALIDDVIEIKIVPF
jgi:hypothetical protein